MSPGAPRGDGRRQRWSEHNEQRRRDILAAAIAEAEANEPGTHVHVQQIAERAGVTRTVVYRHFADRAELDRAVQAAIVDELSAELLPTVSLQGTIPEIVERIVARYVSWAVAHPALHRLAEQDTGLDVAGPLHQGIERIAQQAADLITAAVDAVGLQPTDDERAAIDPLVFGLVGAVFSAVRRWLSKPQREPAAPVLVALVTQSVWHILNGHARSLGLVLDPKQPVEELLAGAARAEAGPQSS